MFGCFTELGAGGFCLIHYKLGTDCCLIFYPVGTDCHFQSKSRPKFMRIKRSESVPYEWNIHLFVGTKHSTVNTKLCSFNCCLALICTIVHNAFQDNQLHIVLRTAVCRKFSHQPILDLHVRKLSNMELLWTSHWWGRLTKDDLNTIGLNDYSIRCLSLKAADDLRTNFVQALEETVFPSICRVFIAYMQRRLLQTMFTTIMINYLRLSWQHMISVSFCRIVHFAVEIWQCDYFLFCNLKRDRRENHFNVGSYFESHD